MANLGRVKSQDRIHRGDYNPSDYKGVYSLYMSATGDERLARKMQSLAMESLVNEKTAK
jgi:hypothetical protein